MCVVLAAELLNADFQAEAHLQSLDNEPLNSLSDECICLLLVGKQLSLNERPDWQKMLAIRPLRGKSMSSHKRDVRELFL